MGDGVACECERVDGERRVVLSSREPCCDGRKENGKKERKEESWKVETKQKKARGVSERGRRAESDERRRAGSCGRIGDRTG